MTLPPERPLRAHHTIRAMSRSSSSSNAIEAKTNSAMPQPGTEEAELVVVVVVEGAVVVEGELVVEPLFPGTSVVVLAADWLVLVVLIADAVVVLTADWLKAVVVLIADWLLVV